MRRSVQIATSATFAALLITGGAHVAQASSFGAIDGGIEQYSVPASEMATESSWSAERMEAALSADNLVADQAASVDFDYSEVAVGEPSVIQAQDAEAGFGISEMNLETPVPHIGKVFFTLGGVDYQCSANAVASDNGNTVATAGHCLNEGPGDFATEFIFVPAYENGNDPYGQWAATELFAASEWVYEGDMNYDGAFAVVESPTGESLSDTVGASGIAFNQDYNLDYSLYGYPAEGRFNGQELHSCYGSAMTDYFGGSMSQGVDCDMTGGSSGGPWFIGEGSDGIQNSVNSFGYNAIADVMWGPYFGDVIEGVYMEAQA